MYKLLLVVVFSGCAVPEYCYQPHGIPQYTDYKVTPTMVVTSYNVGLDDPNSEIDLGDLQLLLDATNECMDEFRYNPLTIEERLASDCVGDEDIEIKSCLNIKVPEWHNSCLGEQIFSCSVGDAACKAKGLTPTAECPCGCRAITQGSDTIITAPNMKILPAQLITLMTGCANPWVGRLKRCASVYTITGI